jgi:hypothetical protein
MWQKASNVYHQSMERDIYSSPQCNHAKMPNIELKQKNHNPLETKGYMSNHIGSSCSDEQATRRSNNSFLRLIHIQFSIVSFILESNKQHKRQLQLKNIQ